MVGLILLIGIGLYLLRGELKVSAVEHKPVAETRPSPLIVDPNLPPVLEGRPAPLPETVMTTRTGWEWEVKESIKNGIIPAPRILTGTGEIRAMAWYWTGEQWIRLPMPEPTLVG